MHLVFFCKKVNSMEIVFEKVLERDVDLLLINFENAATTSGNALKGDVPLKCDPSYVPLAKANNNTIASLANNHAFDYGIDGMGDTLQYLKH